MNRRRSRRPSRYDLDLLDLLGAQRAQVGEQLLGLHAQFAVVDIDLRARLAVYRDLLVVDPNARCAFQQLDAVLADRRRCVGHVDHEAVCLAADELRLDHHAFDPGRRAFHHDLAQVVVLLDPHLPHDGVEPEVLYRQGILARRHFQHEAARVVGGHARHLVAAFQQHDRSVLHGLSLFVHHAALGRIDAGCECVCGGQRQYYDEEDKFFHTILLLFVICTAF